MRDSYGWRGGLMIARESRLVVLSVTDTAPLDFKPGGGGTAHLVELYRARGYPLGKNRKGLKKYLKRILLKALNCKSANEARRKYTKKNAGI
jgi:hypothetical protein